MRSKSLLLKLGALLLILSLVFVVACGQTTDPVDPVDDDDDDEPTGPREGGVVTIAVGGDPVSTDPHLQRDWVSRQGMIYMYDSLVYIDGDEEIQPMLATSWTMSDDGLTYVFELRDDVKFHDGTPFNADAVKFNYERMLHEDSRHFSTLDPMIESVEVLDEFTVQFNLKRTDVNFLPEMAWSGLMVSPTAVEEMGDDFARNPVGTGPFKFKEHEPDSHIEFVRNEDYWAGRPPLDGIRVRVIPESSTRVIELEAGNLDMAYTADAKDVDRLERAGLVVETRSTATQQSLSINVAKHPTSDLNVRKAVVRALDRQLIIDEVLYGAAEISRAGVPSTSPFYHADVPMIEFDLDEAGSLLDEAGWVKGDDGYRYKDGEKLEMIVLTSDAEVRVLVSQIIQEQLRQIGIDAEVVTLEWGAYLDAMRAGDYHLSYWSLASTAHRSMNGTANLKSDAHWNVSQIRDNPELAEVSQRIDEIVDLGAETLDDQARFDLFREFQMLTQEYQLIGWMWHVLSHNPVQPWVHDYDMYHYNIFYMQDAWKDR